MKYLSFLLASGLFIACANDNTNQNTDTASESSSEDMEQEEPQTFGATIDAEGVISFEELMTQLEEKDTAEVKIEARVSDVCQKKGCWMNVMDPNNAQAEPIFVRFKDYGFFMPFDLAGSDVVVRGKAFKTVTSVEELRHYAEDAGQSEEEIAAITEPEEELAFMADGVLVTNRVKAE